MKKALHSGFKAKSCIFPHQVKVFYYYRFLEIVTPKQDFTIGAHFELFCSVVVFVQTTTNDSFHAGSIC